MYHFYAMLSRMKYINRWGLMRNSRYETLTEHCYDVAVLAHCLALIRNTRFGGDVDEGRVMGAALYHDMSEIIHGDMPTPVKYSSPDLNRAYKEIEGLSLARMLCLLPEDLQPAYRKYAMEPEPEVKQLIKAADRLSALIKCMEELRMGNGDFQSAYEATSRQLEDIRQQLPEVGVFLEEFLPSYGLDLDRLQEGS